MALHNNEDFEFCLNRRRYMSSITSKTTPLPSVKAGFLHNTQELLLVHFSVSIPVCFVYHLLHKHTTWEGIKEEWRDEGGGLIEHVSHIWCHTYVRTCSSSSVRFSPSSLATLFRFLKEILPVSSSSKRRKAFRISSLESFSAYNQRRVRVPFCRRSYNRKTTS